MEGEAEITKYQDLLMSPTVSPTILFVCRESREDALKFYQLTFGYEKEHLQLPNTVYFNFDIDTLYFEYEGPVALGDFALTREFYSLSGRFEGCIETFTRDGIDRIQRLGISYQIECIGDMYDQMVYLKHFTGLKEVILGVDCVPITYLFLRDPDNGAKCHLSNKALFEELTQSDHENRQIKGVVKYLRDITDTPGSPPIDDDHRWQTWWEKLRKDKELVPHLKIMRVRN